ncbi:CDGSH iron-sulfur domain-containing protein 1 isoform X3 [Physeter macrocephalus]|nr:CDGSH iron-sulfur domain-containing protein 1 isoform X3 [Physeter catodon]XP_054937070.1 CDGSH iron-sulfur domain-containing protein 1 isoform X3 [Physeter catodon]
MQNSLLSKILWNWAEWIAAVTIAAGTAAVGYLAYKRFYVKDHRNKSMVNPHIQKDNPKVVHAFDMEDLGDKAVYCRCWRSKKFFQPVTDEQKSISVKTCFFKCYFKSCFHFPSREEHCDHHLKQPHPFLI